MRERFTENAEKVLKLAKKAAKNNGNGYIGSEHLLLGLLEEGEGTAAILLKESGADTVKIRTLVANLITSEGDTLTEETDYTPRTEIILENAVHEADFFHMEKVGTEHLLLALLKDTDCCTRWRSISANFTSAFLVRWGLRSPCTKSWHRKKRQEGTAVRLRCWISTAVI